MEEERGEITQHITWSASYTVRPAGHLLRLNLKDNVGSVL